jgi:lambda family phage portal protein
VPGSALVSLREKRLAMNAAAVSWRREREQLAAQQAARRRHAQRAVYAGAAMNRLNADWIMSPMSADAEVRTDLRALKLRARQVMRDNVWAKRYARLQQNGIAGPFGMTFQSMALGLDGAADKTARKVITDAFKRWCRAEYCSADGRLSFRDHQRLAVKMWKGEGEHLVLLIPNAPNEFGFAIQALDADLLDETYNVAGGTYQNEVRMGVELNELSRPVAYWLWSGHPYDMHQRERTRRRIPAEYVVHLYTQERPGQTRGISELAVALQSLNMLDGADEAILALLRASACKMGFLTFDPEETEELKPAEEPVSGEGSSESGDDGSSNVTGGETGEPAVIWDAEPGKIEQLPKGFKFDKWDPGQPGPQYQPFRKGKLQDISAGLDVSYASLTGDLAEANYGSQRVGMLNEREGYLHDHGTLAEDFNCPIFRAWLQYALLKGAVRLPGYELERYGAHAWQPRGFDWIDPEKDINADLAAVEAGLDTLTDIAARKGRVYAENLEKRRQEIELARKLGVPISLGRVGSATPQAATPAKPSADAGDAGDDPDTEPDEALDEDTTPGRAAVRIIP